MEFATPCAICTRPDIVFARELIVQLTKGICGVRIGADLDKLDPDLG